MIEENKLQNTILLLISKPPLRSGFEKGEDHVRQEKNMDEPNPKLMDVIFLALDHGIDSVRASGGPLIPFTITEGSKRELNRFATEQLEEAVAKARAFVEEASSEVIFYAVSHDGFITVEGRKFDSILVEGGERGAPKALIFAQRYEPKKGFFGKFKTIGNAVFISETENRLK